MGVSSKKKDPHELFKNGFSEESGVKILKGEELVKLQNFMLGMLKDFKAVADKHDLTYSLSGGSVLGTIRHQGFIPWDDDIDINMPRAEYDRFEKIFEQEMGDKYELCTPKMGKNHGMALYQLKRKGTVYQSYNELSKEESGICMDIFVIENTYNNGLLRKLHGMICLAFGYALTCRKTYFDMPFLEPYLEGSPELKNAFEVKAKRGKLIRFIKLDTLSRWTIYWYSKCKNNSSKYVTIPSGRKHYFGELCDRSELCDVTDGVFAGETVKIPKRAEDYMKRLYGPNYMQIPPVEKRESHPIMKLEYGDEA